MTRTGVISRNDANGWTDEIIDRQFIEKAYWCIPDMHSPQRLPGELWGVAVYFNPAHYTNKRDHFIIFSEAIRKQRLKLLVVEAVVGADECELDNNMADILVSIRVPAALWMKEALINLGVRRLPTECDKVVWLDADILFANESWVESTRAALESFVVVQPFSTAFWLKKDIEHHTALKEKHRYAVNSYYERPSAAAAQRVTDTPWKLAGHMGFAWGIRRQVLEECPLYSSLVIGGADYIIASAMFGLSAQAWMSHFFNREMQEDLVSWMQSFHRLVRGSVGYVPGAVLHLWHGERKHRKYQSRYQILREEDFSPRSDLTRGRTGELLWGSDKPRLHRYVAEYFLRRREDE